MISAPEESIGSERVGHWKLVAAGTIVLTILLIGAWYGGRESAGFDAQRLSVELDQLQQQVADNQLALKKQKEVIDQLQRALHNAGKTNSVAVQADLRRQLLKAQAEANEYKDIVERERQAAEDNSRLVEALSHPEAHLVPMKGAEAAADSTAYALLIDNSHLTLVASNLPQLDDGRQFQLWIVRKEDPKIISAGVFDADDNNRALVSINDRSVLSDLALVEVTEEPDGGSEAPTGTKLFETLSSAGEAGRSAVPELGKFTAITPPTESSLPLSHRDTSR